jgi:ribonuclease HI
VKSQILADFITEYSSPPDQWDEKWELYVNKASSLTRAAAGIALWGPKREVLNYTLYFFLFFITNNIIEYEVMITGLKLAKEI